MRPILRPSGPVLHWPHTKAA